MSAIWIMDGTDVFHFSRATLLTTIFFFLIKKNAAERDKWGGCSRCHRTVGLKVRRSFTLQCGCADLQRQMKTGWQNKEWTVVKIEIRASGVAQTVKNPPAMQETQVQSLGWEDPLEKGMATHSSILAWRTPWTEEPGELQSTGSQSQTWLSDEHFHFQEWNWNEIILCINEKLSERKETDHSCDGEWAGL